jgi:SSS family solute:Na+ symporter
LYTAYANDKGQYAIPFLISMGWVFFFTVTMMVIVSLLSRKEDIHTMEIDKSLYKVSQANLVWILIILGLLTALYIRFW